jgi:hypothetical protein
MRARLIAIGFVTLFMAAILIFIDQICRHFDDGAFPLHVGLNSKSDRRINRVSVGVLMNDTDAERFKADPNCVVLDSVNWNPGSPFEVRVIFGGEYSGFGRELSYGQGRFLALSVEFADGGKEYLTVEIPKGPGHRQMTVELP